ncbi:MULTISPECIES: hypothetical protein [unclassified Flavobacterium]|jgi:hypothetical protein|uniref:hypothetical protein n=1 Tax=unclassified Flavobacterium TaxID=196869 RepID=UPI00057EF11B|nr:MULTISPECIES: hypothetical protein [unclassified Flavobacterium]KIA98982.1 hypothetical protein OA93_07110 [Flavobacterium sp. KMS]KIC04030.1 hypothetical protein OA88_00890 [Flavobacterium sp. JRM]MEA9413298.1 hypothetical protein [Flavobacterium sp. PL02]OUL64225.1 hypothetical protein B8T70_00600 [Flavobacterium sp. AJR]
MIENKEVANSLKLLLRIFIAVIIISTVHFLFKNAHRNDEHRYRKTFKGETIGLTLRIKQSGKSQYLRYCFYSGKKKILGGASIVDYNLVNKFYKVKYDLDNPEKGHYIILKEELKPDSISLVKAGFTKVKYYTYDGGVTCKYIEGSKWK